MSLTAFSLVCLAALLHAGWNLATKRAGASGAPFIWAVAVVSSVLWAPLALGVHGAEVTKLSLAA